MSQNINYSKWDYTTSKVQTDICNIRMQKFTSEKMLEDAWISKTYYENIMPLRSEYHDYCDYPGKISYLFYYKGTELIPNNKEVYESKLRCGWYPGQTNPPKPARKRSIFTPVVNAYDNDYFEEKATVAIILSIIFTYLVNSGWIIWFVCVPYVLYQAYKSECIHDANLVQDMYQENKKNWK